MIVYIAIMTKSAEIARRTISHWLAGRCRACQANDHPRSVFRINGIVQDETYPRGDSAATDYYDISVNYFTTFNNAAYM